MQRGVVKVDPSREMLAQAQTPAVQVLEVLISHGRIFSTCLATNYKWRGQ